MQSILGVDTVDLSLHRLSISSISLFFSIQESGHLYKSSFNTKSCAQLDSLERNKKNLTLCLYSKHWSTLLILE